MTLEELISLLENRLDRDEAMRAHPHSQGEEEVYRNLHASPGHHQRRGNLFGGYR